MSLSQALTMVYGASQTQQAMEAVAVDFPQTPYVNSTQSVPPRPSPSTSTPISTVSSATRTNSTKSSLPSLPISNPLQISPTFPLSNVTVRPTYTPKPTKIATHTPSPTATRTPTATQGSGLPGLTMSDVINKLTSQKGFSCTQVAGSPGPVLWMCDVQTGYDLWYHVDIYGSSSVEVNNLAVSVFQTYPDETKTLEILTFVASLPFTGSNASAASQWITQTLPLINSVSDVREKTIGGILLRLYGSPQGRFLELGESVQQ